MVTTFFADNVDIPIQQVRLYNIARANFAKLCANMSVDNSTTVATILDGVANSLKPKLFDLHNREKLLNL